MLALTLVSEGSSDIAVGISGFGSAKLPASRWQLVADMTGRTTYGLSYEAQELPWPIPSTMTLVDLYRRWSLAREAAQEAADYLAGWIRRWTEAGRNVLIVGFSLGGFVAWRAVQQAASENVEVILMCAALGNRPEQWEAAAEVGALVNLYSTRDLALKRVYPVAVRPHERPAAGLAPLMAPPGAPVHNIDVTDLVGWDHLWASQNIGELTLMAMSLLSGIRPSMEDVRPADYVAPGMVLLDGVDLQRLYRWMNADPVLWELLGRAIDGDSRAAQVCALLDDWSLENDRLPDLFALGRAASALEDRPYGQREARRSQLELAGILRDWLTASGFTTGAALYELSGLGAAGSGLPAPPG